MIQLDGLTFKWYSQLNKRDKTHELRKFINKFSNHFNTASINSRGDWRKRLDDECLIDLPDTPHRNVIVAYNYVPVAAQQFSISPDGKEAYGEGIYVDESCRGMGIAVVFRDVLYNYLIDKGVEIFNVGKTNVGMSGRISCSPPAQRLAERVVADCSNSVFELVRTPKKKLITSYSIDLWKYKS